MNTHIPSLPLPAHVFPSLGSRDSASGRYSGNGNNVSNDSIPSLSSLSHVAMSTPANLFNSNFNQGMSLWNSNLPPPQIYDSFNNSNLDETAQSQNEIVQKVLLRVPSAGDQAFYEQFEFFFIRNDTLSSNRNHYSSQTRYPYTAVTLCDLRKNLKKTAAKQQITYQQSTPVKAMVDSHNPMGVFFTYVDTTMGPPNESKLVAYAIGGLCDILNVWHVQIIPGMTLYFVAYKPRDEPYVEIIPYAGISGPLRYDSQKVAHEWKDAEEIAILNVGIVCACNSRPPLQTVHPNYLVTSKQKASDGSSGKVPATEFITSTGSIDPTQANRPHVQGNVLRIRMSCLQWEYYSNIPHPVDY
jgi:hypothetical protein